MLPHYNFHGAPPTHPHPHRPPRRLPHPRGTRRDAGCGEGRKEGRRGMGGGARGRGEGEGEVQNISLYAVSGE